MTLAGDGWHTEISDTLRSLNLSEIVYLDASSGMLKKAVSKFPEIEYIQSPAEKLPFENDGFDLVYMTDVAHHLSDVGSALQETYRILHSSGRCCVVTQSHNQIEKRMTSRFFPETVKIEQRRYPSISHLCSIMKRIGFSEVDSKEYIFEPVVFGNDFLNTVEQKGFSILHKIPEASFFSGLRRLRTAIERGSNLDYAVEYTFVWATK